MDEALDLLERFCNATHDLAFQSRERNLEFQALRGKVIHFIRSKKTEKEQAPKSLNDIYAPTNGENI